MKNKIITGIVLAVFGAGLLVFNYPVISTLYNQLNQGMVLGDYDDSLEKMQQEELDKSWKEAQEYNENLVKSGAVLQDAFSRQDWVGEQEYMQVLDFEESGVMGSIEIPGIDVYLPFYHGTDSEVLKKGVGHQEGTSIPVGGESVHAALTGHRGLPRAELFNDLDQMKEGDIFYIHILKRTLAYQVYDIEVIEPNEVERLAIIEGRDLVTLVTCTPYGINSHRLLIHGERVPYQEEKAVETQQAMQETLWQWLLKQKSFLASAGVVVLAMFYGLFRWVRCQRKKYRRGKEEANL